MPRPNNNKKRGGGGGGRGRGAAQVHLSADNQRRLRRLLQNTSYSAPPPQEALSDSQKKQAAKRLRNIYDQLASQGFSTSQIELALAALPVGEVTSETVLDWLCLNIPGHELPIKFSSSGASEDIEGGSVQLLAAARADWVSSSVPCGASTSNDLHKSALRIREAQSEDAEAKAQQADWIRQYLAREEEEEDGSGSPSVCSDNDSDWEAWVDSKERQRRKHTRSVVDPATRALSIAAEFEAAKDAAVAAKQKGDKQKQAISGQLIRELKQEIESLGLSEDILKKGSGFLNSRESGSVRVDCDVVMPSSCEDVVIEISGIAEAESTHTCSPKESSSVQQMQDGRAQIEAEGDMLNLFDEDNAKLDGLPESIVDLQKKEKAATWAMRQATLEKRQTGHKKKSTNSANQEDTKRQPKAVLQQHCQKNGWEVPKYEKLFGRHNMYLYNVTIVRPNSGRGKNKTVGGLVTYSLPGEVSALESMEEAQNGVATWALFCLFPDLPLYHILVEPYRAMLLQWHAQGAKTVIDKDLENARRSTFVDSLVNAVAQDRSHASSDIAEPQKFPDKDSKAEWSPLSKSEITTLDAERCKSHIDAESLSLLQMFQEKTKQKKYKVMLESRSALPVSAIKGQLLHHLHDHEVVVVSGETGSGKTTQVPQYILEEMITNKQGSLCNIVCTQPRRLAAISIAERVAAEQGDEAPGSNGSLIGYQVRLDSAWNSATKLLFCTTGILLRRLAGDKDLKGVSHVIVDEVHERTVLGDFTLIILKDLVERRRGNGQSSLKIILMSATVDASIFSRYFGNCPVVMVKGRTFPVDTMYLEDIYEVLDYRLSSDSPAALSSSHTKTKKNKFSQSLVNSSRGRQSLVQSGWGDEGTLEFEPCNPMFDEGIYHGYSERTQKNLSRLNEDIIDFDFLEEFISHIIQTGESGAILVFLPGITDIYSLVDRLAASKYFCNDASEWLIPLHSSVSNVEQRKVFQTAPVGVRKVVVATNIAETSITIDDVVHVIDCGKHKEMQFDPRRVGALIPSLSQWLLW